jgi:adenosylcobinamide kinase/adenosylcobinamide-phosphate guanylyltransferase
MSLVFLLGGARSGKSSLAIDLARQWDGPVVLVATAEARDEEMAEKIRRHRAERPRSWTTIEEPFDLSGTLAGVDDEAAVVVDCLSLWVANALDRGDTDPHIEEQARAAAELAKGRRALTVVVSNEVGLGIVPATPLGRSYRDVLGRVNTLWASAADDAALVVAGRAVRLESLRP